MTIVIVILMAAASVIIVAWPIIQSRRIQSAGGEEIDATLVELMARRDNLLAAIKDMEFDHAMGKIGEEDFKALNAQLRAEAIELLKEIDRRSGVAAAGVGKRVKRGKRRKRRRKVVTPSSLEAEVEAEIAALRRRSASATSTSPSGGRFCTHCGAPLAPEDRFCGRCGRPVAINKTTGK